MNSTQIGDITEYRFALYCMEHSIPICKPMTNNLPYDYIIELNGKLLKIQVKTGYKCKSKNSFMFNTRSTSKNYTEVTFKSYKDKVDGFVTYYPAISNKFFYIPITEATDGNMRLYFGNTPKCNQRSCNKYDFNNLLS